MPHAATPSRARSRTHLPAGCSLTVPAGGFFLWLTLPPGLLASDLLPVAERRGVAFAPGRRFCTDGDDRSLRLAFSLYDEASLAEGARRLAAAIAEAVGVRPKAADGASRPNAPGRATAGMAASRRARERSRKRPAGGAGTDGSGRPARRSPSEAGAGDQGPGDRQSRAPWPPIGRALTSRRAPRIRTGVALFLVVVSVLAVLVSTLALWSSGVIFDTEAYVKVGRPGGPGPRGPQVGERLRRRQGGRGRRPQQSHRGRAAGRRQGARPRARRRALQSYLVDEIDKFLGTPLAQRLWVDINRFAHQQLITALQDENRYVTVGRDDVKLDLLPLVAVALQRLETGIPRLLGKDVTLPTIDPVHCLPTRSARCCRTRSAARCPRTSGRSRCSAGARATEAKQALRLFKDLVILVVVVTIVLIAAALLVSVRRWRTALWLGLGSLLAFVAARVIEVRLEDAVVGAVKSQGGVAVARSIVGSAIASLNTFLVWIAVAGAIVAVAALLAGRPEWLDAMGRGFAKLFGVASDLSTPDTSAGRWMAEHLDLLRIAGVAVAVVVLLFVTGSLTAVIAVIVALAVYELALAAYAIGVPRELDEPPADGPETPAA